MKKQLVFTFLLTFSLISLLAQNYQPINKGTNNNSGSFWGISTGINNQTGIIGFSYQNYFTDNLGFCIGAGLGTWGYKLSLGTRISKANSKSGFLIGFSRATGVDNVKLTTPVETPSGTTLNEEVIINCKPVHTFNIAYTNFTAVGSKGNRLQFDIGFSLLLNDQAELNYSIASIPQGHTLTSQSKAAIKAIQPGGLLLGMTYYFANK